MGTYSAFLFFFLNSKLFLCAFKSLRTSQFVGFYCCIVFLCMTVPLFTNFPDDVHLIVSNYLLV